jgi:hypothetical protein
MMPIFPDRAIQDNAFFTRLAENPAEALKECELTDEEKWPSPVAI